MTIWDCRTHVRMTSMTSSVERTDLDFKISVALMRTVGVFQKYFLYVQLCVCDFKMRSAYQNIYSWVQTKSL